MKFTKLTIFALVSVVLLQAYNHLGYQPESSNFFAAANDCKINSPFLVGLGFKIPAYDTSINRGAVVYETSEQQTEYSRENPFSHETWDDYGYLGSFAVDKNGTAFTAPLSNISITYNKFEDQNTILSVNRDTGTLEPFFKINAAPVPDLKNPFGIMSLAYDCLHNNLYAASISGTKDIKSPKGSIYVINLDSKKIIDELKNVDAVSLAVANTYGDRKLFFGLAGEPKVMSIPLDSDGKFARRKISSSIKTEIVFDNFAGPIARKILIGDSQLDIVTSEFAYNLVASTSFNQKKISYKAHKDGFTIQN